MDRSLKQRIALSIATLSVLANAAIVCADSSDLKPEPIQSQLDALHGQLDSAQRANEAVRIELEETKFALDGDNWMSKQRAAEITMLVQDVLEDTDTRLSLQGDGTMMGWSDGFHMTSADGRFQLNIGGMMQSQAMARWVGVATTNTFDKWRYGFGMSRSELTFGGNAFGRGIAYYFEMGWGRGDPYNLSGTTAAFTARLWDAWIKFRPTSNTEIKIGQFMLPFSRESLIRPEYQLAVFPSLLEYRMGLERTAAIELNIKSDTSRFSLAVSNGSPALYNAPAWHYAAIVSDQVPPWPALEKDTLYAVTMRHEWKLLGNWEQFKQFTSPPGSERGVLLGVAGHRQNIERESPFAIGGFPEGVFWGVTGDVTLQYDGASLFASVIYERVTDFRPSPGSQPLTSNFFAYILQGSTYVTNQTELFARYEAGGPDKERLDGDKLQILTVGVNHYVDGQDLKFTADIGFSFGEVSQLMANTEAGWIADLERRNQFLLRTQVQLLF